jgi:hypothetical protein
MEPAPEGSDERRWARMALHEHARNAFKQGASFDGWLEREHQPLIDAVTERDLEAIFQLVWKPKKRRP